MSISPAHHPSRWSTARRVHRDHGSRGLVEASLGRLGVDVFQLFEAPIDAVPDPFRPEGLELGWLRAGEADACAAHDRDADADVVRARLGRGDRCYVAREGARIVSSRWHVPGRIREEWFPFRFSLAADEVYVYGVLTGPRHRGRGVAVAVAAGAARGLATEGAARLVSLVYAGNAAGLRSAELAGGTRRGSLLARGRIALLLRDGRVPRLAVGLGRRSSPTGAAHVPAGDDTEERGLLATGDWHPVSS